MAAPRQDTDQPVSPYPCEMAGCTNRAAPVDACGIVYLCDACRALVDQMARSYTWAVP